MPDAYILTGHWLTYRPFGVNRCDWLTLARHAIR